MVGLQGGTWAARRDASGLHIRPGHSIRPRGDRRFRLTRTKHDPPGRCRGGHAGRRCCRPRRGRPDFSRCGRGRQRQITRLTYRRGGIARDSVFGDPYSRAFRLDRCQARYFGGKAEDAFRRAGAGWLGGLSWGRAGRRELRRQVGRDPMPRGRGLGPRQGILTRRIAAVARRRCAFRVHRPSPTLTSAIAGTTAPNSAIDRRTPENVGSRFRPAIARPRRRTAPSTLKANMAKGRNRESHVGGTGGGFDATDDNRVNTFRLALRKQIRPRASAFLHPPRASSREPAEDQRGIRSAEAERVG